MVDDEFSCIKEVTKVIDLPLPAMYNTCEISGIYNALEGWKRQYVKQLQGIVVGYKNVSLTSVRGYIKVDSPMIYCNVKATFELFNPTIGSIIKGKINRISKDHISCLVHNTINVTVYRTADISSDISNSIALDCFILFQITRINFKSKFIHVKGKITDECITLMKESGMLDDNIKPSEKCTLKCSSPDFSNSNNNSIFNNNLNENAQEFGNLNISTDNSSQVSPHKKKKKHKKSKESFSMSPSLISESLANNVDEVELDKSRKRKRKESHENLSTFSYALEGSSESVHPKKKIKTEEFNNIDVNQFESTQSSSTQKRKHKKSDVSLSPSTDILENESKPKKKRKTAESNINDTMEFLEKESSLLSSDVSNFDDNNSIFDAVPAIGSPKTGTEIGNSNIKAELSTPVKKKKHKKHKNSIEASSTSPDHIFKTEINENESSSLSVPSPSSEKTPPSSHTKLVLDTLTSPDLFDEPSTEVKSEEKSKKKKKKDSVSDKKKLHKKKKDKLKKGSKKDKSKKGSKKDKKKKIKVISTKKKLHGHGSKLKKKKNKDKKSKEGKKKKLKNQKSKEVPQ